MFDTIEPKIKFPNYAHINSFEHTKKYAKNALKSVGKNFRDPLPLEAIPYAKFNVSDELLTLLFAGVGVYSTNDKTLCPNYQKTVLEMASNGQLAYIIADVSICYGTNYPISRIIVTDEFAKKHSINTLFQLFGRAGRVGRSWMAVVYVSQDTGRKLVEYAQERSTLVNVEAENMTRTFNENNRKTALTNNAKLASIIEKYLNTDKKNNTEQPTKIIVPIIFQKMKKQNKDKDDNTTSSDSSQKDAKLISVGESIEKSKKGEQINTNTNWRNGEQKCIIEDVQGDSKNKFSQPARKPLDFGMLRNNTQQDQRPERKPLDFSVLRNNIQQPQSQQQSQQQPQPQPQPQPQSQVHSQPQKYQPPYQKQQQQQQQQQSQSFNFDVLKNNDSKYMSWRKNDNSEKTDDIVRKPQNNFWNNETKPKKPKKSNDDQNWRRND